MLFLALQNGFSLFKYFLFKIISRCRWVSTEKVLFVNKALDPLLYPTPYTCHIFCLISQTRRHVWWGYLICSPHNTGIFFISKNSHLFKSYNYFYFIINILFVSQIKNYFLKKFLKIILFFFNYQNNQHDILIGN